MKISVIGCGRWGSFITWYLDHIGHDVTLYGRENSKNMARFLAERKNDLIELGESIKLSTNLSCLCDKDIVVISISSQQLKGLMQDLKALDLKNKIFVLCMKGIDTTTLERLSEIVQKNTDASNKTAVWLGPGHVQEFYNGVPNCMVIDSEDEKTKKMLVDEFSSDLIRFYYGTDLLGNEIGAAAKKCCRYCRRHA